MNLQYPITMLDENGAKIVAVSDDQVVLYWQGVEAIKRIAESLHENH